MTTIYILACIFLICALFLLMGKGSWLIAGFNTASKEEKEMYNKKKLCRTMGFMCLVIGILTILLALINNETFAKIYGIVIFIIILITMVVANTKCKK